MAALISGRDRGGAVVAEAQIENQCTEAANGAPSSDASEAPDIQITPPEVGTLGLWAQIREDYNTTGRDWTKPGFRALVMIRFGQWRYRLPKLLRMPCSLLYRLMNRYCRNHYGIELYDTTKFGRRVYLAHQHGIAIHPHSEIGDDCIIRQEVTLGSASHKRAWEHPILGKGVQVGAGSKIVGNARVGDYVRIGANVVITGDVPAHSIVLAPEPRIILRDPPQETDDTSEPDAATD
jgi:serine acetyltransferase